jgi:glutathione S-transferase
MGVPMPGAVDKAEEALAAAFERLDRELEGREFFAGAFSLADCEVIPFVAGLEDVDI